MTERFPVGDTAIEKARHMVRRHSDEFVSRYLGMDIEQVRTIRRLSEPKVRGRPKRLRPVKSETSGFFMDNAARSDIRDASLALGSAIDRLLGRGA